MKTIGLHDDTYQRLFLVKNKMEREKKKRISFSTILDMLIDKVNVD